MMQHRYKHPQYHFISTPAHHVHTKPQPDNSHEALQNILKLQQQIALIRILHFKGFAVNINKVIYGQNCIYH